MRRAESSIEEESEMPDVGMAAYQMERQRRVILACEKWFPRWVRRIVAPALGLALSLSACATDHTVTPAPRELSSKPAKAEDLLVVDCLLPGQIRQLGTQMTYLAPRRPVKTSAQDCEIRGGEYVSWDRADYRTALKVWLPQATEGDAKAQTYVGEIYEKGLGTPPDYAQAAQWYRRAADAGSSRAAVNLGQLYEQGLGVPKDASQAARWYRKAAGSSEVTFPGDARGPGGVAETVSLPSRPAPPASTPPPAIDLTEPALVRPREGRPEVRVQAPIDRIVIAGRVTPVGGLKRLTVNNREERVGAEGDFRTEVQVEAVEARVRIEATDQAGRMATQEFLLKRRPESPPVASARPPRPALGNYHALVIGNDDYRLLPRLGGAVAGSTEVARILRDDYGFSVTVLTDASRLDILVTFNTFRQRLTESDNLLIYYSGHGRSDGNGKDSYWLPVDAEPADRNSWIPNRAVTAFLDAMTVRQALVATDSCYSGTLSNGSIAAIDWGSEDARRAGLQNASKRRSRVAMTSAWCDPSTTFAGQATPFTRAFLEILRANWDALPGQEMFSLLRLRMATLERPVAMGTPQYVPIKYAGHEAGDFVFPPSRRK